MGARRRQTGLLVAIGVVAGAIALTGAVVVVVSGDDDAKPSAQVSSGPSTTRGATSTTAVAPTTVAPSPSTSVAVAGPTTVRATTTVGPTTAAPAGRCESSVFAATLSPDKTTYGAGDPVVLKASFRNTSRRACTAGKATVVVRLIDANGRSAPVGISSQDVPLDPAVVGAGETVTLTQRIPDLRECTPAGCVSLATGAYTAVFEAAPLGTARAVVRVVTPTVRNAPPDAVLAAAAGEVVGGRGSYCWRSGGTGLCADTFGFPEGVETLSVRRGEQLTLSYVGTNVPTQLFVTRSAGQPDRESQHMEVTPGNPVQFRADFPAGTWWLSVLTRWSEGDATHYFRIEVR